MITCSFPCGGAALLLHDAETAFHDIVEKIGLPRGAGLPRPTIHSLRHTFAVRASGNLP